MDTLTHALSGALIGRATAPQPTAGTLPVGRRVFICALTAAFPDLDIVTSYLSPLSYLYHHRGVTHSLLMVPVWAVLLSFLFAFIWRRRRGADAATPGGRDGPLAWKAYVGVAALGIVTHIAGDLITSFGTMIFAPFSDARYALSFTFIIDLWLTGIILLGLAACALWRRSRAPAFAGLAMLVGYIGFQGVLQQRAIEFGEQYARASGLEHARVTGMPRPVSPFNWTVIVEHDQSFHYAHVNLLRDEPRPTPDATTGFIARLDAPYRPLRDAHWSQAARYGLREEDQILAREVYAQPGFAFFRWFAAYPAVLEVRSGNPEDCVWFYDLRFLSPGRDEMPFRYGMCRRDQGPWQPFQLTSNGAKRAVY
jgi:inner membrane protein